MNFNNDQLRLKTVKELRAIIKENNLAKNYQTLSKSNLIKIIEENQSNNNFNINLDSESESESDDLNYINQQKYEKAINLLIDDEEDDDDLTNFDIVEGKQPKRKLQNKKIDKPLQIKQYKFSDCKKDIKQLLESHKKLINNLYEKYRRSILDDEDIEDIINTYNDLRNEIENEINMCIDDLENEPPNSFYSWIENSLDLHKNKIEKLIS